MNKKLFSFEYDGLKVLFVRKVDSDSHSQLKKTDTVGFAGGDNWHPRASLGGLQILMYQHTTKQNSMFSV